MFGQRLDRLSRGEGGVVIITGEAGLGKSRLMAEARAGSGKKDLLAAKAAPSPSAAPSATGRSLSRPAGRAASIATTPKPSAWPSSPPGEGLFGEEKPEVLPYLATLFSLPVPDDLSPRSDTWTARPWAAKSTGPSVFS